MASKKQRKSKPAATEELPSSSWSTFFAGAAFLVIAIFICYWPAINAGYVWDDPQYVLQNATLRTLGGLRDIWLHPTSVPQWYPLVHTSFWIEYHLVGTWPMLFHIDNVLLHCISSILIWRLLRKLEIPGAFLAACIFALHPVMVESVAWVTERKNCLSLVFYLLAMWVYLLWVGGCELGVGEKVPTANPQPTTHNRHLYFIALALFLAALFSKTVTASLPAAILLILWWKRGRLRVWDFLRLIPFFILGAGLGIVTGYLEKTRVGADSTKIVELHLSLQQRCLIAGRAIWFYAGKLCWPHPLTFIYPRWSAIDSPTPAQWIWPVLVIVVSIALVALRRRIGRGPATAWLFFCGTLFPALGFVNVYPMRFTFVADHFQYHASIGIIVLVAAGVVLLSRRSRIAKYVISAVLLAILGTLTFLQCTIYQDAETIWRDTLSRNTNSWMVYTNLANALLEINTPAALDEADGLYRKALVLAPNIYDTHSNVGMMEGMHGNDEASLAEFSEALRINPTFTPAYYGRGLVHYREGHLDQAIDDFRTALQYAPQYPQAHFRLGVALEQQGKLQEAVDHYRLAVAGLPGDKDAHYNLGTALIKLHLMDEAIYNLQQAVQIDPGYAEAWTNLGGAQLAIGRADDAIESFKKALEINPGIVPAQHGLEAARARAGH